MKRTLGRGGGGAGSRGGSSSSSQVQGTSAKKARFEHPRAVHEPSSRSSSSEDEDVKVPQEPHRLYPKLPIDVDEESGEV